MTITHEETIESHVNSNVAGAIDQMEEYGGLQGAMDSYYQNTVDSVLEDGYTADEAMSAGSWFIAEYEKKTQKKYSIKVLTPIRSIARIGAWQATTASRHKTGQ